MTALDGRAAAKARYGRVVSSTAQLARKSVAAAVRDVQLVLSDYVEATGDPPELRHGAEGVIITRPTNMNCT